MPQVFMIGATGHIGGAVLHGILDRFVNVQVVALVRDNEKAQKLQQAFSGIQTRVGSLQDVQLIESESRAARIVIIFEANSEEDASPDGLAESVEAIKAALRGLEARTEKGFYIQTSGAFIIGEEANGRKPSEKVWSDIADIETMINIPLDRFHSRTDQLVRQASDRVNVAIVSPTVVYGLSPLVDGGNRIPITVRDIISTVKDLSMGFTMSEGRNVLGYVHVRDLAEIYISLVADGVCGAGSTAQLWGPQAYYLACSEEHTFAAYMQALVDIMKDRGTISTDVVRQVDPDSDDPELVAVREMAAIHGFGANVRCRSDRAAHLLKLVPKSPSLFETLPEIIGLA